MKLITTTPSIRYALDKSKDWDLKRSGHVQPNGNKKYFKHYSNAESSNRITYTYLFNHPMVEVFDNNQMTIDDWLKERNKNEY